MCTIALYPCTYVSDSIEQLYCVERTPSILRNGPLMSGRVALQPSNSESHDSGFANESPGDREYNVSQLGILLVISLVKLLPEDFSSLFRDTDKLAFARMISSDGATLWPFANSLDVKEGWRVGGVVRGGGSVGEG